MKRYVGDVNRADKGLFLGVLTRVSRALRRIINVFFNRLQSSVDTTLILETSFLRCTTSKFTQGLTSSREQILPHDERS